MAKIAYQIDGQDNWKSFDSNQTMYILKGTKAKFRAETTNASSTSRAFDNTGKDIVLVDVSTGVVVNVIVFSLTPVLTFVDNFKDRSVKDVGVCEEVKLDVTIDPPHVTAEDLGGLRWFLRDGQTGLGKDGIIQKSATASSRPDPDGKAYYLAPTHTAPLPLQFDANATSPRSNQLQKAVYLRIVVQDGFSKDLFFEQELTVHTPKASMIDEDHIYQHVQYYPSAGFKGRVYLEPKNVSFAKILWREGEGTASAFATSSPGQPGGYFIFAHEKKHVKTGRDLAGGKKEARTVGTGDVAKGCKVEQIDIIFSGCNGSYPHMYNPEKNHKSSYKGRGSTNVNTDVPSVLSWVISWQYCRAESDRPFGTPLWIEFQKAEHRAEMDDKGRVTMSKAGASKAFDRDDENVSFSTT